MGQRNSRIQTIAAIGALLSLQAAAAEPLVPPQASAARFFETTPKTRSNAACGGGACDSAPSLPRLELRKRSSFDALLLEPRADDPQGQTTRPRLSIGMRSYALESALDSVGLAARHCLAPVVRMNARMSTSFSLSGTLWVSMRCSFD